MNITVVGAGIIGLCAAIRLAEAGHDVGVITHEPSADTTSTIAGAVWSPYGVSPDDRVLAWSVRTLEVLAGLVAEPHSGSDHCWRSSPVRSMTPGGPRHPGSDTPTRTYCPTATGTVGSSTQR